MKNVFVLPLGSQADFHQSKDSELLLYTHICLEWQAKSAKKGLATVYITKTTENYPFRNDFCFCPDSNLSQGMRLLPDAHSTKKKTIRHAQEKHTNHSTYL